MIKQKFLFLLGCQLIFGQQLSVFSPPDHIKSVLFYVTEQNTSLPIVGLNEQITLKFDDLNADDSTYYYTIDRFDAHWNETDLFRADYIHYTLTLPNAQTRLKMSGNYLLNIWDDNRNLVLQKRFLVTQQASAVGVRVQRSQRIEDIQTHQSVQFVVNLDGLNVRLPEKQIKPFIVQNQRWQTWRQAGKSTYNLNNQLQFNYKPETTFAAGTRHSQWRRQCSACVS